MLLAGACGGSSAPAGFLQPGPCPPGLTESSRTGLCTLRSQGGCAVADCYASVVPGATCVDLDNVHASLDAYECELKCGAGGSCPAGLTCHPPYSAPGICANDHPAQPPPQETVQVGLSAIPAAAAQVALDVQIRKHTPSGMPAFGYFSAEVQQSLPGGAPAATAQVSIAAPPSGETVWGVFSAQALDASGALLAATSAPWKPAELKLSGALIPLAGPGSFLKPGPCQAGLALSPVTNLCTATFASQGCDELLGHCLSDVVPALAGVACLQASQVQPAPPWASECAQPCGFPEAAPCPAGQSCTQVGAAKVCAG